MIEEILNNIPVTINDCRGDPLFPMQFNNTIQKLRALSERKGPNVIITKGILKKDMAKTLTECIGKNTVIIYSLTGLNEGGISFKKRVNTIYKLKNIVGKNIIILIRPIIPYRNDSFQILKKIIDITSDLDAVLVYGGYKKEGSRYKYTDLSISKQIKEYADKKKIISFTKSACGTAHILNRACSAHDEEQHIDSEGASLIERLGYKFYISNDRINLKDGSLGDYNFIRFVTKRNPEIKNLQKNIILSFSRNDEIYEATSSYFIWSRNIPFCFECDYCLIEQVSHLKHTNSEIEIGCNPIDLIKRLNLK